MYLLVESIKVENRKLWNLEFHSRRLNKSRKDLFNKADEIQLDNILRIPSHLGDGIYKCRVLYAENIKKIEWSEYIPREIKFLKVVRCEKIDYSYKYSDRELFNILLRENDCRENCDMLIIKNGRVTDTSYGNVALFDGKEWHTTSFPLLKGTKREELLQKGLLLEKDILLDNILQYKAIKPINAMLDFEKTVALPVDSLIF